MSILQKIKFNPAMPIIARGGGRGLVGSLNFSILNLIQQSLKQAKFGLPTAGVDTANDETADIAAQKENARNREEQGFTVSDDPLVLAARLKLIRDAVAKDLRDNADMRPMVLDPHVTIPDVFHVGSDFEESIEFQKGLAPRLSEAQMKAEAKALNVSVDDVRNALMRRHARQVGFLNDHEGEIIAAYHSLTAVDTDGYALDLDEAEAVLANLPAIYQLRIAAAVDKGLYRQRNNELERALSGNAQSKGNIGLIDGTRREILAEVDRWTHAPQFKTQIEDAINRGTNLPAFAPVPHVQEPDEVDAIKKAA